MFHFTQSRARNRSRSRRFANRVWARLEELEPRSLLAVTTLTAAQALPPNPQSSPSGNIIVNQAILNPPLNNVPPTFQQRTVLSVDYALDSVPIDSGALEFQTPARSTGEYFLSNQGLLPQTPAALQTVSKLPSLSQGITRPAFVGGATEGTVPDNRNNVSINLDPFDPNVVPAQAQPVSKPEERSAPSQLPMPRQLPVVEPQDRLPPLPPIDGDAQGSSVPTQHRWEEASASVFAAEGGESLLEEPSTVPAPDLLQAATAAAGALAGITWYREPTGQRRWRVSYDAVPEEG